MNKFKILKYESKTQIILSAIATVICLFTLAMGGGDELTFAFLISLFLIGFFNIIGFIIRLIVVKNQLNFIYIALLFGYFVIISTLTNVMQLREEILINIGGSFAVLLNVFYLWYGDYLVKNWAIEDKNV
ncbi:hypothetical protein [Frigoriflavimonas asaccharolytica]|uniref:Uncharacterized protein n=1 Tax=Frigoriflavimonas asaccharolytica TaxID=2735899 RepID=A0A8J8G786_9FLAO|nr:hypothetical protein [Frigoriflavimonas asaccharolytica]NRS91257.1 hypothetical protein [Frigoriflavimonas asaccharolytica]